MPIYEFVCDKCGNQFEELVTGNASGNGSYPCPNCRSTDTHKLMSACARCNSGKSGSDGGYTMPSGGGCGGCSGGNCSSCGR